MGALRVVLHQVVQDGEPDVLQPSALRDLRAHGTAQSSGGAGEYLLPMCRASSSECLDSQRFGDASPMEKEPLFTSANLPSSAPLGVSQGLHLSKRLKAHRASALEVWIGARAHVKATHCN